MVRRPRILAWEQGRRRLRSDDGFGLIEVLASALVVVMVTIATYGALESASRASGRSKARSVAAALAEKDQERLRAMRASDLSSFDTSTPVVVDGVTYTVRSQGIYTSDAYDSNGCTATGRVDYVKIITTVSAPVMGNTRPVRIESLVHPPAGSLGIDQGALGVQVRNAAGAGVAGLTVNITGPASYTKATDSNGCVFFPFTAIGQYTVSYGTAGWVDPSGTTNVSFPATVSSEHSTFYQKDYDQKGRMLVTLESRWNSANRAVTQRPLRIAHNNMPGFTRVTPATAAATMTVDNLFPFTSPYDVYAGDCSANVLPASLVSQFPANTYQQTDLVAPGDNAFKVFVPAFYVRVLKATNSTGGTAAASGVTVKLTPTDAGCSTTYTTGTTNASGEVFMAVPYGTYSLCSSATGVNGATRRATVTNKVNNQYNPNTGSATTRTDITIPWTGTTGTCP